jgi:uncharacterized membrane protein YebE (DUF533 family)
MFDAEKLLGGLLLGGARRKSGLNALVPGGAGMALLGVAIEAFEHFTNKPGDPASYPPPPPGPPPASGSATAGEVKAHAFPPPPPPGPPPALKRQQEATLLIRAMIAAAGADGTISPEERHRILDRMGRLNPSPEEQSFLEKEFSAPAHVETLVGQVRTAEMARQVYAVSLLAIEVDTVEEGAYLKALAGRLGLDPATVAGIHRDLGVEPPSF